MLTVKTAGARVARDLEDAERMTNETLRAMSRLQQSMLNVRLDTQVPQYQGQVAFLRLQEAQKMVVDAMSNLTKAHKSMRDDFTKITGLPDEGPGKCPASGELVVAEGNQAAA